MIAAMEQLCRLGQRREARAHVGTHLRRRDGCAAAPDTDRVGRQQARPQGVEQQRGKLLRRGRQRGGALQARQHVPPEHVLVPYFSDAQLLRAKPSMSARRQR